MHTVLVGMECCTGALEDGLVVSCKMEHTLPIQTNHYILGIYPKDLKADVHTKVCTQVFIVALLVIPQIWTPPRCPSEGEWIKSGTSIHWNVIQH